MRTSFFPSTDAGLLAWSNNFSTLISAEPAGYGLTAAQATAYASLNSAYSSAYTIANTPANRTKPAIEAKDTARTELKDGARLLVSIIQGTATVTDAQKLELGLKLRKTPSPVPVPADRPGVDIVSVVGRTMTIHIHDTASSTRRGKPAGAAAAWVYTFVGENYPSDPTLWDFNGAATRAKFDIEFPGTLAGGTQVWVCAAWVNGKGEAGMISVPISTTLQGGGSSSQGLNTQGVNTQGVKIAA